MAYVVGVDGGNSKTRALVADDRGRILGAGHAGGSNHQSRGLAEATGAIRRAVEAALAAAGVPAVAVDQLWCGLAGADLPEDFDRLRPALAELRLARRVELRNDTQAAMRAGTRAAWGVVVVCGSGFNVAGRAPDGRELTLPALGWISGDRTGGRAIAQEMIRLVMRASDGRGRPTLLGELVPTALGQRSADDLMLALYRQQVEPDRLLRIVPLLFEAAVRGDEVAQELILETGDELALGAAAVIRRLGLAELPVEVVLSGGVFEGRGPLLVDAVRRGVHRAAPEARVVRPAHEPVVGAVLRALEVVGVAADDALYEALESTLPAELRLTD